MKTILHSLLALLVALALSGCGTTKKALSETRHEASVDSLTTVETTQVETEKFVDTTRTEHGKVIITEIEFYPPEVSTAGVSPDIPRNKNDPEREEQAAPPTPMPDNDIQGVGKVKGAIKSIKQTVIEADLEEKGQSGESERKDESKTNESVARTESDVHIEKQQETKPNKANWFVFALMLSAIAIAVLLYLKRVPVLNFIRKLLAGIRRIY